FGPETSDQERRDNVAAAVAGWGLLAGVIGVTAGLAILRRRQVREATGPSAAFLLLGAWLCCFHFMYYDVLLAALPVLLLFAEPARYFEPLYLTNVPLGRVTGSAAAARWAHPDRALTRGLGIAWVALLIAAFPRA